MKMKMFIGLDRNVRSSSRREHHAPGIYPRLWKEQDQSKLVGFPSILLKFAYTVRSILINRSQPHPVRKSAEAGGKMTATRMRILDAVNLWSRSD